MLLDLMLPRFDGIKICKKVRESKDIPILVITARGQIEDKVEVLQAGADDYITKPFSFKELLARIQAVMRRYKRAEDIIRVGDLVVNLASHEVIYEGDYDYLKLALANLLENAYKYIPKGGFIKLYYKDDCIVVEDSGVGIEDKEKVFEAFYSENMESEKGKGSRFYLCKRLNP